MAGNALWLLSFPLDTPRGLQLAPLLATHAVAWLGTCDTRLCDARVAAVRRFETFLSPTVRAGLQGDLMMREMKLAGWREPRAAVFGVLLPLSGPFETFGRAAKEALDLAATAFPGVTLVFRDTAADPTLAESHAEALIFQERVSALIGPVGRHESAPVIAFARRWGIALLPLTLSVDAIPEADDPVLRLRTSPVELAVELARFARSELGRERVAVLVAEDPSFREQAEAFAAELTRLGGTVVRTIAFDPNAKSFEGPLATLVQSKVARKAKVDFDALYVAAPGAAARRLASHLDYWGVPLKTRPDQKRANKKAPHPVQLLGSWGWSTTQLIDRTTNVTNNSVFPEVFASDLADEVVVDFVRRFFLVHHKRPSGFQAEVFDALRVAVDAELEARTPSPSGVAGEAGASSPPPQDRPQTAALRDRLVAALLRERTVSLATGTLTVLGQKAQPRAHMLTVDGSTLRSRVSEDEEQAIRSAPTAETGETPPENPAIPALP
jgi:hypothetical protein